MDNRKRGRKRGESEGEGKGGGGVEKGKGTSKGWITEERRGSGEGGGGTAPLPKCLFSIFYVFFRQKKALLTCEKPESDHRYR